MPRVKLRYDSYSYSAVFDFSLFTRAKFNGRIVEATLRLGWKPR